MRIYWLLAAWVTMTAALPSGPRDDMEVDDEPYYTDLEPGLDLIAEESEAVVPVTLPAPPELQQQNRTEKDRSLMLVMPLTPSNTTQLEELYTKRPETRIVETTTPLVTPAQIKKTQTTLLVHPTPQKKLPTPVHITLPPPVIRPDIKDLLASIGLHPAAPTTTTTPTPPTADSFSPEIQDLLAQYGVQANDFNLVNSQPVLPSVDVSSYSSFKPIPDQLNVDEEMKELLAKFGLVGRKTSSRQLTTPATPHESKKSKSPAEVFENQEVTTEHPDFKIRPKEQAVTQAPTNIPTLHPHSMTKEMKRVLYDLGLAPHISAEEIAAIPSEENNFATGSAAELLERSSGNHEFVFNPTDVSPLNDTMEEKLKDILNNFKQVQGDEAEQASQLLSKYRKASLSQNDGPDPLSNDELLLSFGDSHNQVHKRQNKNTKSDSKDSNTESDSEDSNTESNSEDSVSSSSTTTSSSADAEEKQETSTEGDGPSIADLESSFGGSGDEVPPPKPNGFYFLLDLNTFLNVGEDDKGVHLRLAPRLGNSKNFLPITVP